MWFNSDALFWNSKVPAFFPALSMLWALLIYRELQLLYHQFPSYHKGFLSLFAFTFFGDEFLQIILIPEEVHIRLEFRARLHRIRFAVVAHQTVGCSVFINARKIGLFRRNLEIFRFYLILTRFWSKNNRKKKIKKFLKKIFFEYEPS